MSTRATQTPRNNSDRGNKIMNAILIGCGSKFGLNILTELLNQGHTVYSLSGSNVQIENPNLHHTTVSWKSVSPIDLEKFLSGVPNIDLIFFNQNGSSLNYDNFTPLENNTSANTWELTSDWMQSYFVSCGLPYYIIKRLEDRISSSTKIAWMLSHLVVNYHMKKAMGYADYIGNKFQNYMIMKNFSLHHNGCFFGIDPGYLENDPYDVTEFLGSIASASRRDLNGTVRLMDFSVNTEFDKLQGGDMLSVSANRELNEVTTSEYATVKLIFDIGVTNGSSMSLVVGDQTFNNLSAGRFETEILVEFPSNLKIVVDGKETNDTIVVDGEIVADKYIKLDEMYIDGIKISDNLLYNLELHTTRNSIVTSNYWGFNGFVNLEFDCDSAFNWIVKSKS